ncbi:prephenate dehydrogenase [Ferrimicrobium acidiphilum]|uniref:prephenate dehydrogenase n=1 Tax=Ferrimicrobium acidiphilum TaxID=121039 RepID=UPI0023F00D87|nr:prephenate dehydrogenase/arogenate dehydrogenase family protein [Ferrimicrobium acidiphilum]
MSVEPLDRVGIVGLGHMGASLAGALAPHVAVVGYDLSTASVDYVRRQFEVEVTRSLEDLVRASDVVVIASPTPSVRQIRDEIDRLAGTMRRRPVVCDIASVKRELALDSPMPSTIRYVSLHPMTGREGNGAKSADPSIFVHANWALVLTGHEEPGALALATRVPLMLGNGVVPIELTDHDRAIAMVSTLPHVSAVAFGRLVGEGESHALLQLLAAGSIRDSVRVARTEPTRIVEMLYPNRSQLKAAIEALISELEACRDNLDDEAWLLAWTQSGNRGAEGLLPRNDSKRMHRVPLPELASEFQRMARVGGVVVELTQSAETIMIVSVGGETSGDELS